MGERYTEADFAAAALITIDTQRDVLDGGPFEIAGTSAALGAMRTLGEAFRLASLPIVHIVRLYEAGGANADLCRREAFEHGMLALTPGSEGSEPAAELLPESAPALDPLLLLAGGVQSMGPAEVAIYKPRWGAFFQTPLEAHVRTHQVSTLVFCGCNFPNCPRTSMYEASERDFRVVLARDALSGLYERGEHELANIGVQLMRAEEIAASLLRPRAPRSAREAPRAPLRTALCVAPAARTRGRTHTHRR